MRRLALALELEAAQRPEWASAPGLFDWAALLLPTAASASGGACLCLFVYMSDRLLHGWAALLLPAAAAGACLCLHICVQTSDRLLTGRVAEWRGCSLLMGMLLRAWRASV